MVGNRGQGLPRWDGMQSFAGGALEGGLLTRFGRRVLFVVLV